MIRLRYSYKLAKTKMHSKRVMLITSVVVSSILFSALIICMVIFSGAEKSAKKFIGMANNGSYLVKVSPVIPESILTFPSNLSSQDINEIKTYEKQYYGNIKAKYTSLNLKYDSSSEVSALSPAAWKSESLPKEQRVVANYSSPVISSMLEKKYISYALKANNNEKILKTIANSYNAVSYFSQSNSELSGFPNLRLIQSGAESFDSNEIKSGDSSSYGYYTNAIYNGSYSFENDKLLQRYLTSSQTTKLKGIPVVVSAQEVSKLFGKELNIKSEPNDEKAKSMWIKDVQSKSKDFTYQACYRNSTEQNLLSKIQNDYAEITSNSGDSDYIPPKLQYSYPKTVCGDISIKLDKRSYDDKIADQQLVDSQKRVGLYTPPIHKLLTFQIVGVTDAQPYSKYDSSVSSYLKNLISYQSNNLGAFIPIDMYNNISADLKFNDLVKQKSLDMENSQKLLSTNIVEFNTISDARLFIDKETCPISESNCNRKFTAEPYGTNYLILDEVSKLFLKIISFALPILSILSVIIMWFTISRIMMESRKETAVYRAMGARRKDIVTIYLIYIILIAIRISIVSISIGVFVAYLINLSYEPLLTSVATSALGAMANGVSFSLFNIDIYSLLLVIIGISMVSILAAVQPLIRNVMRLPIDDMRKD